MLEHSEFPYHTCVHCKVFPTAAPRRARTSISVSFSGQPLSRPLPVVGLVGNYPANYLMGRQPIFRHRSFEEKNIPVSFPYSVLASVSQGYPEPKVKLSTCYWAVCQWPEGPLTCMSYRNSDSSNLLQDKQETRVTLVLFFFILVALKLKFESAKNSHFVIPSCKNLDSSTHFKCLCLSFPEDS